jgi:serine/threonine protein kinase/tetratricopeptide (TPR) repeat protein
MSPLNFSSLPNAFLKEIAQDLDALLQIEDERERRQHLAKLKLSEPEKGRALEQLLDSANEVELVEFLDYTLEINQSAAPDNTPSLMEIGDVVGSYRLTKKLADGGMSTVWVAERIDGSFDRLVAIKSLPTLMNRPGLEANLRAETALLGRLAHQGIAQLFDAGISTKGEPFLVLEYVDGVAITDYCDQQRLTVEERIQLMVDVCEAVSFLHNNLVVHCDLKPSNILVDKDGRPKLLDLGIARLMGPNAAADTSSATARAYTPNYAAPEQMSGDPVTTSTDVFGLGALLYHLLVGVRANQGATTGAQPEKASSKLPTAPSLLFADSLALPADIKNSTCNARRISPGELKKKLEGDIDGIVLHALEQVPSKRYPTAQALANDLRAFLAQHPVSVAPSSATYQAKKFISRHKLGVFASTLAVALLIASSGAAFWQARRANQALMLANVETDRANQQTVIAQKEAATSDREARRADAEAHRAKEALLRAEQEADRALNQSRLAQQQAEIARVQRLRADAERATSEKAAARAQAAETDAKKRSERERRMRTFLTKLLDQANTRYYSKASPTIADLVKVGYTSIETDFPDDPETQIELNEVFAQLLEARPEELEIRLKQYEAIKKFYGERSERAAESSLDVGFAYGSAKNWPQMEKIANEVLNRTDAAVTPRIRVLALRNRAMVLLNSGRHELALIDRREMLQILLKTVGPADKDIANVKNDVAAALSFLNRNEEAIQSLNEAFEHHEKFKSMSSHGLRFAKIRMATLLAKTGKYTEALNLANEQLAEQERVNGINSLGTLRTLESITNIHNAAKQHKDVIKVTQRIIKISNGITPIDYAFQEVYRAQIAYSALGLGDLETARSYFAEALVYKLQNEERYSRSESTLYVDALIAQADGGVEKFDQATSRAEAYFEKKTPGKPKSWNLTLLRANVLAAQNHAGDAYLLLQKRLEESPESDKIPNVLIRCALVFAEAGKFDEALQLLATAERDVKARFGEGSWLLSKVKYAKGLVLNRSGKTSEGSTLQEAAQKEFRQETGFELTLAAIAAF